ncbi:MAG: hypothetical protein ABSH34_29505 [Verrucomicrobiota bacterium]|jgi:hypothetical protein
MSIDALVKEICDMVNEQPRVGKKAIPEQYDLLRTIQLVLRGYRKPLWRYPQDVLAETPGRSTEDI